MRFTLTVITPFESGSVIIFNSKKDRAAYLLKYNPTTYYLGEYKMSNYD